MTERATREVTKMRSVWTTDSISATTIILGGLLIWSRLPGCTVAVIQDECLDHFCDDDDACTIDECRVIDGEATCVNTAVECPAGSACLDGTCTELAPCPDTDCDDGNPCTDDLCYTTTGECTHVARVCGDDDLFCNGVPECDRQSGACESRNPCRSVGPCDEDTDSCVDPFDSELCLSQCEPPFERCDERPLEDFPDFEDVLFDAPEMFQGYSCDGGAPSFVAARCTNGALDVVDWFFGEGRLVRFYDQQSGQFVAQLRWSDGADATCLGKSYWPVRVDCDTWTVTKVVCGTEFALGDELSLR